MAAKIYAQKSTVCKDCGEILAYKTAKPLRYQPCRARLSSASSSRWGKANRDKLRINERERYRRMVEDAGRTVRQLQRHEDQSPEARKMRQAETCRLYREKNPEKRRQSAKEWARRNREKGLARFRERYATDPMFNLAIKIRRRIHMALRSGYTGKAKAGRTIDLLGCSYESLKTHIERQFTKGMTWDGCFDGSIQLDHIIPCSSFDLSDPEQQRSCFGFTNLRPLWAEDNLKKSDKRTHLI